MKKIFLYFCIYLLHQYCNAQTITAGLRLGLSYSGHAFKSTDLNNQSREATGLSNLNILSGAAANFEFNKNFSLESEILIENKGSKIIGTPINLWHLHFPQYLRYSVPVNKKSNNTFFIEAGPYFAWLLKATYVNKAYTPGKTDIKSAYTSTDWGLGTGFGYRQKIGNGFLEYNLRYEFGLNNVLISGVSAPGHSQITTVEYYRVLLLSCQYSYPLNKLKIF